MSAPQRVFTPGAGAAPPALTGREREQGVLTQCLADLLGGNAPPHDVALMGPRGNGKTVLLNWFAGACRDAGRVDVARLSPSRIRTGQALADALLPVSFMRRATTPTTISCLPLLSPARLTVWSPEIWRHLLHLKKVQQTRILTARELTELLN